MAVHAPGRQDPYHQTVRELSDRLVEAQRPIRILDAIKWDNSVQEAFFAANCKEPPPVDRAYYEQRPIGFDPVDKRREFQELAKDVQRKLGTFNPVGVILKRMCREYETVVRMLECRGLPEFSRLSQELYGSTTDVFHAGDPTLADLGSSIGEIISTIDQAGLLPTEEKTLNGEQAAELLQKRLNEAFNDPNEPVKVLLSDGILADAAAGADYLKVRKEAMFTERDIRLLFYHEGWVHLGTTLNGMNQPICTFLSKGPPSSTVTQEGLAMLMEVLAFASHPERLRKLTARLRCTAMAEDGANFREVYRFNRELGYNEFDSFVNSSRIFRGSTPNLGPFTKDISYSKGFVMVYNFVLLAVRKGLLNRVPLLFCGKTTLEDMAVLGQLVDEGLVTPPKYLPPQFADMNALIAWMCCSQFLNRLNLDRIEADYAKIL